MNTKQKVFVGLFLGAFLWVLLMGLLSSTASGQSTATVASSSGLPGGQRGPSRPTFTDDGSVKARVTDLDRDKFHIKVNLSVTDKEGKELDDVKEQEIVVFEDGVPVTSTKFTPTQSSGLRVALAVDFGDYYRVGQDQRELIK